MSAYELNPVHAGVLDTAAPSGSRRPQTVVAGHKTQASRYRLCNGAKEVVVHTMHFGEGVDVVTSFRCGLRP